MTQLTFAGALVHLVVAGHDGLEFALQLGGVLLERGAGRLRPHDAPQQFGGVVLGDAERWWNNRSNVISGVITAKEVE